MQYPQESPPVVEKSSTKLRFYKSNGCNPFANQDSSHDDDTADLLQDAIDEVYGPSRKHPHVDDTAAMDTAVPPSSCYATQFHCRGNTT